MSITLITFSPFLFHGEFMKLPLNGNGQHDFFKRRWGGHLSKVKKPCPNLSNIVNNREKNDNIPILLQA